MLKLLELNRDCVSGYSDTSGAAHVVAVEPRGDQIIHAVNRADEGRMDPSGTGHQGAVSEFVA